jgi:hypothetical protein
LARKCVLARKELYSAFPAATHHHRPLSSKLRNLSGIRAIESEDDDDEDADNGSLNHVADMSVITRGSKPLCHANGSDVRVGIIMAGLQAASPIQNLYKVFSAF